MGENARKKLERHIESAGIRIEWSAEGYHRDDHGWEHQRFAVTVTSHKAGKYSFTYRRGVGLADEVVTDVDLIASLLLDASTVDYAPTFDEWATEYGYFPIESAKEYAQAVEAYNACQAEAKWTHTAFGSAYRLAINAANEL